MSKVPGWLVLLTTVVEVCTLALIDYATAPGRRQAALPAAPEPFPSPVEHAPASSASAVTAGTAPQRPPLTSRMPASDPDQVPPYLLEVADHTAQIMRGRSVRGPVFAGFYPDGAVRFVGADGVGFEGRSENAMAVLTDALGERTIRMQVGVSPESKLQITLLGGPHDSEILELEMIPETK